MINTIAEMLSDIGCSKIDIDMIILCTFFAAIGGIMNIFMISTNLSEWPVYVEKELQLYKENMKESLKGFSSFFVNLLYRIPQFIVHIIFSKPCWIVGRVMLSAFAGLIVALYFLGSFPAEGCKPTGPARVFILSALVGYLTPALLIAQEKWILKLLTSDALKNHLLKLIKESIDTADKKEEKSSSAAS